MTPERFPQMTQTDTSGCVIWTGAKSDGYGLLRIGKKTFLAHRIAYERDRGPIPKGYHIDHLCRNRACVNTDHLRLVTPRQNALENSLSFSAINAKKTHCLRGHEFTEENTAVRKGKAGPYRSCRECIKIRAPRYARSR